MSKLVRCEKCGYYHNDCCPDVKVVKFYPDGEISEVEYYSAYEKRLEAEVESRIRIAKKEQEQEKKTSEQQTKKTMSGLSPA